MTYYLRQSIVYTFNSPECQVCGTRVDVALRPMRTMYHTELGPDDPANPNNCYACGWCMKNVIDPYWDEKWREYYASVR